MAGQVSAGTVQALNETRPWVKLISVVGMIGIGLMLLGGIPFLAMSAFAASRVAGGGGAPEMGVIAMLGIFYLAIALLYVYPIIKLSKYSRAIRRLSQSGAVSDLEDALTQQKSFWKFVGILMLIVLVIYIGVIVLLLAGGVSSASFRSSFGTPSGFPVPAGPP